jgi:alkanesulfonate monooxygenase SsuD/methylene tetrahydromethanopterin reductase-like flavin-dependent oxidoreductase (luciferase family)/hemerythrin-like domain-containing protein
MTDYGHELRFGSFITPTNEQPQHAVTLAQVSERAGLDLVTFQDHPYQPSYLDTWTLIAYVLSRTSTIIAAPNVANLPLRPPAVLARSAASLDLLSDGRVKLGIGAGAFWDAIEAMGVPRRSAKASVKALAEAIEIIRGVWDAGATRGLRVDGEYYHVSGAKRGPAPAHDISIWVGAYKPAMLALTGRVGDGWLPSLGYIQPEEFTSSNAIIDEAALEAGRRPEDVRRLLNVSGEFSPDNSGLLHGTTAQWVEQLAEMALNDGFSTFIIGSDDSEVLERFGNEVAPAVRELVASEREYGLVIALSDTVSSVKIAPSDLRKANETRERVGTPTATTSQYDRLGLMPTPDDGTRLSNETLWDESTRPTRPESSEDVTYTNGGRRIGSHLIDVHKHLRAELAKVRDLMDGVRAGAIEAQEARDSLNEMKIRQNDWTLGAYCAAYCRLVAVHHGIEDNSIFPYLRSCEDDLEPVIDRLVEEHNVIHNVLDRVDRELIELVAAPGDFSQLQSVTDLLTDVLLSHLAYEEEQLLEPLARFGFYPGQLG